MTGSTSRAILFASAVALAAAGVLGPTSGASAQPAPAGVDEATFALIVRIAVRPDRAEEFLRLMQARVRESRTRPEVIDFRLLATDDPSVFVAFESFRSKAAFDAFAASPDSASFVERVRGVLARPLEVERLRPLP